MEWLPKEGVQASWLTAHKLSILSINYESPYGSLSHLNKETISFRLKAETLSTLRHSIWTTETYLSPSWVKNHLPQQSLAWLLIPGLHRALLHDISRYKSVVKPSTYFSVPCTSLRESSGKAFQSCMPILLCSFAGRLYGVKNMEAQWRSVLSPWCLR